MREFMCVCECVSRESDGQRETLRRQGEVSVPEPVPRPRPFAAGPLSRPGAPPLREGLYTHYISVVYTLYIVDARVPGAPPFPARPCRRLLLRALPGPAERSLYYTGKTQFLRNGDVYIPRTRILCMYYV